MNRAHRFVLFLQDRRRMFRWLVHRHGVPWSAVDDVLQDAAMELIRMAGAPRFDDFTPSRAVRMVLYTLSMDHHQRRKHTNPIGTPIDADGPACDGGAVATVEVFDVLATVEAMPWKLRNVVEHVIDGGTPGSYFREYGIPRHTAGDHLKEARAYLRRKLHINAKAATDPPTGRAHRRRANPSHRAEPLG